jgi:hypothetical protein
MPVLSSLPTKHACLICLSSLCASPACSRLPCKPACPFRTSLHFHPVPRLPVKPTHRCSDYLSILQVKPACPAGQACMSSRPSLYVQQAKPVLYASRPSLNVQQAKPACPAGQACMSNRPSLYVQQAKPVCPAGQTCMSSRPNLYVQQAYQLKFTCLLICN